MRVFIDTNIFLDLILKRTFYKEAMLLFNAIEQKIFRGYILDITILNIDYIAKKQITDIREFLDIINQTCVITGASNSMIRDALAIDNSNLEDNLQYLMAKESRCEIIITNNKNFYSKDIEILSSLEFLDRYLA